MAKKVTEKSETKRLEEIFQVLPPKKYQVAQGLIVQAARHRVRLDYLWRDIQENGETEEFRQSDKTEPYQRKRPVAEIYTATDTNYQKIMAKLLDLVPEEVERSKLQQLLMDDG